MGQSIKVEYVPDSAMSRVLGNKPNVADAWLKAGVGVAVISFFIGLGCRSPRLPPDFVTALSFNAPAA